MFCIIRYSEMCSNIYIAFSPYVTSSLGSPCTRSCLFVVFPKFDSHIQLLLPLFCLKSNSNLSSKTQTLLLMFDNRPLWHCKASVSAHQWGQTNLTESTMFCIIRYSEMCLSGRNTCLYPEHWNRTIWLIISKPNNFTVLQVLSDIDLRQTRFPMDWLNRALNCNIQSIKHELRSF